jgi:serpin B
MKQLLAFVLFALLVGCNDVPVALQQFEKPNVEPVVQGNTKFALDLYAQLRGDKGSLFLSPYSISSALAMTYAGAREKTAEEMKTVLTFPDEDKLNAGFRALNEEINGEPNKKRGYKLTVANSLWGQKGYPWNADFLGTTKKFYGAGLQEVDFRTDTEKARVTINEWVEKQTADKIKDLLAKGIITPDTRLVLTNAIYFKGDWASQFKKDRTQDKQFKMDGGKMAKVPMMHQTGKYAYGEDAAVQVLKMPYAGKELEMVVILPKKVDGLPDVEKSLTPDKLKGWITATRDDRIDVGLPKFKLETQFQLKDALMKMGMPLAFDEEKANFTGMASKEQLYISAVVHKAFVEVNEEGTEAAAATGVVIATPTSVQLHPSFIADHPFLFLIRDSRNGSILFLGRYIGPG